MPRWKKLSRLNRSADLHSAVSPVFNWQHVIASSALTLNSVQPTASRRNGRLKTCATARITDLRFHSRPFAKSRIAPLFAFTQIPRLMSSGRKQYPFNLIEPKWQKFWDERQTFRAFNPGEVLPPGHPFA